VAARAFALAVNRILNQRPVAAGLDLNRNTRFAAAFAFSRPIRRHRFPLSTLAFLAQTLTPVAGLPPRLRRAPSPNLLASP
jgi:hypothetical protein